ncbi:MAG: argininosuccinate lyase [Sumerlaeia bacterium]
MDKPSAPGPVWAKRVAHEERETAALNVAYCAGRDVKTRPMADEALIPYDLATNTAHALMLAERGILSSTEAEAILRGLAEVKRRFEAGDPVLDPACEDVHMSSEVIVTEIAGPEAGGRLHTGRSRNDQVATDMRLWLRERLVALAGEIAVLTRVLADHAKRHANTVCPGFTHMQPAMVTTWGHWVAAYLPRFLRDLRAIEALLAECDECPLGAAASYGTSWPIDRNRTAELLGFKRPAPSTIDAIWSRGELESRFAAIVAQVLSHLSGIGQDLILFSTPPREWLRLPDGCVTGSSIMPQKRNPDFAEVTRSKAAVAAGHVQQLLGIAHALPGGYNRDTQWTKYIAMDVAEEVRNGPLLFAAAFEGLKVNTEEMREACREGFLNATDVADFLARSRKLPFRSCYRVVGAAVKASEAEGELTLEALNDALAEVAPDARPLELEEWLGLSEPERLLSQRTQTGGPHPDAVAGDAVALGEECQAVTRRIQRAAERWQGAMTMLMGRLDSAK